MRRVASSASTLPFPEKAMAAENMTTARAAIFSHNTTFTLTHPPALLALRTLVVMLTYATSTARAANIPLSPVIAYGSGDTRPVRKGTRCPFIVIVALAPALALIVFRVSNNNTVSLIAPPHPPQKFPYRARIPVRTPLQAPHNNNTASLIAPPHPARIPVRTPLQALQIHRIAYEWVWRCAKHFKTTERY